MKNYRLVVDFHAENDKDAKQQTQIALSSAFDDGFEGMRLTEHKQDDRLVMGRATLVGDE